ncbi:MAG TPA: hypothetical protein VIK86_06235 [Candidatus Paceibacterota bacterium]
MSDKNNYGVIGIDRAVLKNIDFKKIDTDIIGKNFVVMQGNKNHSFRIMKNQYDEKLFINYVKISKSKGYIGSFNELIIGVKEVLSTTVPYEFLDSTLPNVLDTKRINVNNINDGESLKKSLNILEQELNHLGFGEIDLRKAKIEELELNININIAEEFNKYEKVLEYFRGLLPKRLKTKINSPFYPNEVYTGFKVGNDSINFKIYDKKKQLLDERKTDIGEECLRLEYRLLGAKKIKSIFKHNEVEKLLEDFGQVESVFKHQLESDLINKLDKDIRAQIKDTIKILKEYKVNKNKKSAIDEYIKNEELLDIEIILGALKDTEIHNNYVRECKKAIESAQGVRKTKLFGNIALLNEILEKLGYREIKINTSKIIEKLVKKYY